MLSPNPRGPYTTANAVMIGAGPIQVINDTSAHTPASTGAEEFYALKAVTDVVIDAITGGDDVTGASNLEDSITILAGDVLLLRFTSITLTSGTAILYEA